MYIVIEPILRTTLEHQTIIVGYTTRATFKHYTDAVWYKNLLSADDFAFDIIEASQLRTLITNLKTE